MTNGSWKRMTLVVLGCFATVSGVTLNAAAQQGRLFYLKRDIGDSAYKLCVRGPDGRERVLVDPAKRSTSDKRYAIDFFKASPDGRHVAYAISAGGSEESIILVLEVRSGRDLPDRIDRAGATKAQRNAEQADEYAFLLWQGFSAGLRRSGTSHEEQHDRIGSLPDRRL